VKSWIGAVGARDSPHRTRQSMGEPDAENFNGRLRDKLPNDLTFVENDIVRATHVANVALMLMGYIFVH
jgi:hypothetical protein